MHAHDRKAKFYILMSVGLILTALFSMSYTSIQVRAETPKSSALLAQSNKGVSCGGGCNWSATHHCAVGLTCILKPGRTSGTCVNKVAANCSASNPCCSLPQPTVVLTGSPTPSPSQNQPTPDPSCSARCDTNKDGKITKDDLSGYMNTQPSDPLYKSHQETITFCTQTCFSGDPIPPADPGIPSQQTPPSGSGGDCSGDIAGVPDGKVDLKDIEQFRRELNKELTTLACDFDKNSVVDVIDFTNYIRGGFVKQSGQGGQATPTPVTVTPTPTIIMTITPTPTIKLTP